MDYSEGLGSTIKFSVLAAAMKKVRTRLGGGTATSEKSRAPLSTIAPGHSLLLDANHLHRSLAKQVGKAQRV